MCVKIASPCERSLGLSKIIPIEPLLIFTWEELEELVCGKPDIPTGVLMVTPFHVLLFTFCGAPELACQGAGKTQTEEGSVLGCSKTQCLKEWPRRMTLSPCSGMF